ncbi:hypothetical protein [Paenibacillus sp. Mc5Re-14]|uniref:hypothetical protein n=1 Tax=Paenibacillus sp. Mc5Re-14 TaxID=1030529 RepID=UPI000A43E20F|nr:hypothetical protein [Paenibacillus sp. Mc5Re-14]
MDIQTLKELIQEKVSRLKRVEKNMQTLLAEINNMNIGLPEDQAERYVCLAERLRWFSKRLDDLSYEAEHLSSELATLKMIENQMSV